MQRDLPLAIEAVERTRRPLERATQLPGTAFTDHDVLAWELEHLFRREWVCAGHIDQLRDTGQFVMVELGAAWVVLVADADGLPRAFRTPAATAAPASSSCRRAPCGGCTARTTRGPTAWTAR